MKNESCIVASWDTSLDFDFVKSFAEIGCNIMFTILASTFYTRRSLYFWASKHSKLTNPACVQCNFHCIFVEWPHQSSLLYQSLYTVHQISLEGDCGTSFWHAVFTSTRPVPTCTNRLAIFRRHFDSRKKSTKIRQYQVPARYEIMQCHSSCYPALSDKAIFIRSASEEQVLEVMKGVDISKAYGYDGVGNKIIKLCSEGFHVYFSLLLICVIHLVITRANQSL